MKKILIFIFMLLAAIPGIAQHFNTVFVGNGVNHATIGIAEAKLSAINLEAGDEIAAFDGSLCVGVVTIPNSSYGLLTIAASKADGVGTGYTEGHPITIKYWDSSWNGGIGKEITAVIVDAVNSGVTPIFQQDATVWLNCSGKSDLVITIGADDKPYDGSVSANVPSLSVVAVGVVPGQNVNVAVSNAHFDTKNVGTGKTVTADVTLSGTDAGLYTVNPTVTTTAAITAKVITITPGTGQNKVYGTVDPPLTYTNSPLIDTDVITGALGRNGDENVGTKAFILGTLTAGSNYSLQIVASPATFTITKAASTTTVSVTQPLTYNGSAQGGTASVSGAGSLLQSLSVTYVGVSPTVYASSTTAPTDAGTYNASATYVGDSNHTGSTSNLNFTIGKASTATVVTIVGGPFIYSGSAQSPATVSVTGAGGLNLTPTASYVNNTDAGTATASYTYAGAANYLGSTDSKTFDIGKASSTTTVVVSQPLTYNGSVQGGTASVSGVGALSQSLTVTYEGVAPTIYTATTNAPTNAGTYKASASYAGDADHDGSSDFVNFTIGKAATATVVTVVGGPFIYTGSAQTPASVRVTGAAGLSLTPTPSYTNNTHVGTATASYIYVETANYLGSIDSKTFDIGKASSTTTVTVAQPLTYNGSAQGGTALATGVGGLSESLTITYVGIPPTVYATTTTAPTDAGTYNALATFGGDSNHTGSTSNMNFTIGKATTATVVTIVGGPFIYTGSAQTPATVSVTGAGGLSFTPTANYANNTNAGTATASYTYAGAANYLGSTDSKTFDIGKASSTTTVVVSQPLTYNGAAQGGTASVGGAGALSQSLTVTYVGVAPTVYASTTTAPINAGTYKASASYAGDADHDGSSNFVNFTIGKASTTTVVTIVGGPFIYTGSAQTPATVSVTGAAGLSLTPTASYVNNTHAGTATASYIYAENANYLGSTDSKTFDIGKALSTTTVVVSQPLTYNGSAQGGTASVSGAGTLSQSLTITYVGVLPTVYASSTTAPVGAGTFKASASFAGDADHDGSSNFVNFTIDKAESTIVATGSSTFIYSGSDQGPDGSTVTGSTGAVTYSYSGTSNGSVAYGPSASKPTLAGSYSVLANVAADDNYNGKTSAASNFTIGKAESTIVASGSTTFIYSGSAQGPNGYTVTGSTGAVTLSYSGTSNGSIVYGPSATKPTLAGSYRVLVSVAADDNYNGKTSAASNFTIGKAESTIVATGSTTFIYSGSDQGPDGATVTGSIGAVTFSYSGTSNDLVAYGPSATKPNLAGSYSVLATVAADDNYNGKTSVASNFTIGKAESTIAATGSTSFIYSGSDQGPDGSTVTGSTGAVTFSYSGTSNDLVAYGPSATKPTLAGSYSVLASVAADDNYNGKTSVAYNFTIGKAASTIVATGTTDYTYNASAQGPDGSTVTGSTGAVTYSYTSTDGVTYPASSTKPTNAGSYNLIATVAADGNFNASSSVALAFTIAKADQSISWSDPADIVYGTALSATQLNASVSGVLGGSATGALIYNPAINAIIASGTQTLGVTALATVNYNEATASVNIDVTKKTVTPMVTVSNKQYDGSNAATIASRSLSPGDVVGSDDVTVSGGTATFDDSAVMIGKQVTAIDLALTGTTAVNYELSSTTALTVADIIPKMLTLIAFGNDKLYDKTTDVIVNFTDDRIAGEDFTVNYTGNFVDANVGTGKTINVTGIWLSGANAGNYTPPATTTATAAITAKSITVTAANVSKVYDGGITSAGIPSISPALLAGDVANFSQAFETKIAGSGTKKIIPSGSVIDGNGGLNYDVTFVSILDGTITRKNTIGTITASNKVYDGNTTAIISNYSLSGVIFGDVVTLSGNATFADKLVQNGKTVTASDLTLAGADFGNYVLTSTTATTTANILNRTLNVTANGISKVYDQGNIATVSFTDNRVAGDVITYNYIAIFDDENVGTNKTVTVSGISMSGADAGNYTLSTTVGSTSANITKKTLVIDITADNKNYDGTTAAVTYASITSGLISGDVVSASSSGGVFDNKNAGLAKLVTANVSISGANSANYTANATAATTANIDAIALVIGITADDKMYDGTTAAVTHASIASGLIPGDLVDVASTNGLFSDANVGSNKDVTADVSKSGTDSGNYTANLTAASKATINKANAVIAVNPYSVSYDGTSHTSTFTAVGVEATPADLSSLMDVSATTQTDAGSYTGAVWTFSGNTNYNATNGTVDNSIAKIDATLSVTGFSGTYDGLSHGAGGTATGLAATDLSALLHVATTTYVDAPGGSVAWIFAGNTNYNSASGNATVTINKTNAVIAVTPYSVSYDGTSHTSTFTAVGVEAIPADLTGLMDLSATTQTNAGTYTGAAWTFAGNTNYNATNGTVDNSIAKIDATISVTGFSGTYDGLAYGASGTATGLAATDLSSLLTVAPTTYVDAPGGIVAWIFAGNTNYNSASGNATVTINKANPVIAVTPYSVSYDGTSHTSTFTAVGVEAIPTDLTSLMNVSATTQTNAGIYTGAAWTFAGNTNYNATNGTVDNTIAKIDATISVTGFSGTYDGLAHGASGTATGLAATDLSSLLTVAPTTYVDAPGGIVAWIFAGNTNYNSANGNGTVTINKANAVIAVTPYSVNYDGIAHTSTFTAVGVEATPADLSSLMDVSATTQTDAGSYTGAVWTFAGNTNYNATNGTVDNSIAKIDATISVTGFSGTYDGLAHGASGTATGLAATDLSSLLHVATTTYIDAPGGIVAWTFAGNTNYNSANGNATVTINKSNAVIAVNPYSVNYDGVSHTSTFTAVGVEATPADLSSLMDVSATTQTDAGIYTGAAWTFAGNNNYNATSGTVDNSIAKIDATIAVNGFSGTYNGLAHGASGTATGLAATDLSSLLTVAPTTYVDAPGGIVAWTFAGNTNYNSASGNATVTINKANPVIAVTPYSVSYDGMAHTSTFTAVGVEAAPADLSSLMDVSATTQTDAGSYTGAVWTFAGNINYNATNGTVDNAIAKANQIISWSTPAAIVYGTALSATELNATANGVVGGSAGGALTYSPVLGTILNPGLNQSLMVTAAATANYNLASKTVTIDVNSRLLHVDNAIVQTKVYDKNNVAVITGASLRASDIVSGDNVTLLNATAGTFAQIAAGNNLAVSTNMSIAGADMGKYIFVQPVGLTGNISAKPVTIIGGFSPLNKVYDGTASASINNVTLGLSGVILGDVVSFTAIASFDDAIVGNTKMVSLLGSSITGADAANYVLSFVGAPSVNAAISAKPLTVIGAVADDKLFDGLDAATIQGASLVGVIAGDLVNLDNPVGTFAQTAVGADIPVTSAFTISGAESSNYSLIQPSGLKADILPVNQIINLTSGWNIISLNLIPVNTNMNSILQTLITEGKLLKVMDESGNSIENVGGWINDIGNSSQTEGYKIKVNQNTTLTVNGSPVALPIDIPLTAGWNIISYPDIIAQSAMTLLQPLMTSGQLVKVMDEGGNAIENVGGNWLSDISLFIPGEGYKVKVTSNCTLTITKGHKAAYVYSEKEPTSTSFEKAYRGNGYDHMNVYLLDLDDSNIRLGDEIGVFDGNICVGATRIEQEQMNKGFVNIPVSANDDMNEEINGYSIGNKLSLKLSRNGELSSLSYTMVNNSSDLFAKGSSVFLSGFAQVTTGISDMAITNELKCYPNPFVDQLTIELKSQAGSEMNVEIYDMSGRKIQNLFNGISTGNNIFRWNGTNSQGVMVRPGIYYVRCNGLVSKGIIKK